MFETLTKSELLDAILGQNDEALVVLAADFGDRSHTSQAVFLGELCDGYLVETAYSDSGYAVVEEGDENDDSQPVAFFVPTSKEMALTVSELRDALRGYADDDLIVGSCDYGDRSHTQQALPINEVSEVHLQENAYSDSGYAVVEDGDEHDDDDTVVVLNYDNL